ncbi:MAG TPA: C25 family cysteine peptidase [Phycisphaerae bacterium]|nr:C25 family cysteine peptidase [Phycisphaerae bacterium]
MKDSGASLCRLSCIAVILAGGYWAAPSAAANEKYLIVSAPNYVDSPALNLFIDHRTARGFDVSVYNVPSGTTRNEIKAYIQSLWGTPAAPAYLLIVGDTAGETSSSTTIPHWIGQGSRHSPTDLPYACMDGGDDWYPSMFFGRFSVTTTSALQHMVEKTIAVESGGFSDPDYARRACMIATDDPTAEADGLHNYIIATYFEPAGFTATRVYGSVGGGTADIAAAVNDGVLFTVYFGHSTSGGWFSPAFYQSDVNSLTNNGLYGLAMGWSCNSAQYTAAECFGETWLRAPNKGAAAYLSSSGLVWWGSSGAWESSRRMERYFFQSFFEEHICRVGPAWQAALWKILADPDFGPAHDHTRNIFEEFVLLGDPALNLPFRALDMGLPEGVPEFIPAFTPTTIIVRIDQGSEAYVEDSGTLHYRYSGGAFQTAPLIPQGRGLFAAVLPAPDCAAVPEYYFSAMGDQGTVMKLPEKAPDAFFTSAVATVTTVLTEDFEVDHGWTVWNDPSLVTGGWERCVPVTLGAVGTPGADFDGSGRCFVTDNRTPNFDVDGGPTVLTSPIIDLSGCSEPYVRYAGWLYCDDYTPPAQDFLDVEVSSDGGETWIPAQHLAATGGWRVREIRVRDFVVPSTQFRMRFSIADQPNNSMTEACLDALLIQNRSCAAAGDLNCDGAINAFDIDPFVLALTDVAVYATLFPACDYLLADINGDGAVNAFDIDPFVELLTAG